MSQSDKIGKTAVCNKQPHSFEGTPYYSLLTVQHFWKRFKGEISKRLAHGSLFFNGTLKYVSENNLD